MKPLITIAVVCLAALSLASARQEENKKTADEKAVHAAIEDYVLSFYKAEPERLERSLSKDLKKMGYWRENAEAEYSGPLHMTFDQAHALASEWNAEGKREGLEYEIVLHEVADKTACGKLTAEWGQDYFQLVKEKDGWRIHHVLWQSAPPTAAK